MEKAKGFALIFLAVLSFLLPLALLLYCYFSPVLPPDFAGYDSLAVSLSEEEKYLFSAEEETFSRVAAAFSSAEPIAALPEGVEEDIFLETVFSFDGRERSFRLYLSPATLAGYITDARDYSYRLREEDCFYLLAQPFAELLLIGQAPPALYLGEEEIPFTLCAWTYATTNGALSSGDRQNTEAGRQLLQSTAFSPRFAEEPADTLYVLYRIEGEIDEEISRGKTPPNLALLSPGKYELVLIAEWQKGTTHIRAGYSFLWEG